MTQPVSGHAFAPLGTFSNGRDGIGAIDHDR